MALTPGGQTVCGGDETDDLDRCDVVVVHPERVREVRARLVAALIEVGEICVCDLAATVTMSESSVSHHLRVLRAHSLVRARREGRMVYYSPDDAHIEQLLRITREHVDHGEGQPS